jgi:hypothetical protein
MYKLSFLFAESIKEWTVDANSEENTNNNNLQRVHAIPTATFASPFEFAQQPQELFRQPFSDVLHQPTPQQVHPNADAAIIHDDKSVVLSRAQPSGIRPSQQAPPPVAAFGIGLAQQPPSSDDDTVPLIFESSTIEEKSAKRREMLKKIGRFHQQQLEQIERQQAALAQRPICPDGGDPLIDTNGAQRVCGAGFDGVAFCPPGYYCSINVELEQRLCCPLVALGSRIHPPTPIKQPYLAMRPSNPGEVIGAGSLPSDRLPALANSETALQSSGE